MKTYTTIILAAFIAILNACSNGQNSNANLSAIDFQAKIAATPDAALVDVRTPEEFAKGHLINAKNIDWNGDDFESQINNLDKSKPVFVYCLSGGRSSSALTKMLSIGFKNVYNLDGGIMKWRGANLPETTNTTSTSTGMNMQQFDELYNTDKMVLIDFYAEWCGPCKKMKPYLDEISNDMKDHVNVVRINTDDNQSLAKELKIDALPTLMLYKNKSLAWRNVGYVTKEEVVAQLEK